MTNTNRLGLVTATAVILAVAAFTGLTWGAKSLYLAATTPEEEPYPTPNSAASTPQAPDPAVAGLLNSSDLSAPANSGPLTQAYLASLPADVPEEEIFNHTRLQEFFETSPDEPLLPAIDRSTLKTIEDTSPAAVAAYLDQISINHSSALHPISPDNIQHSFQLALAGNGEHLATLISQLTENISTLQNIATPPETIDLHQKIIAGTTALRNNAELLLQFNTDVVASLYGAWHIDQLQTTFTEINTSLSELDTKYQLE